MVSLFLLREPVRDFDTVPAGRLGQDGVGQLQEGAFDVDVGFGGRLQKPDAVLAGNLKR